MAARKTADLVVKVGEYQDQQGNKKAKWQNVGRVMQGDDGSEYLMINRTFNPAGVPDLTGKGGDAVLIRKFEPRNNDQAGAAPRQATRGGAAPVPGHGFEDMQDDMPF